MPIPFPDVAGKGNPSTMFADPDAGHAVNAKSKNRNAAITFALWMGGTKEGQQVVVNNMDSFATLNGVTPQFDKIKLVNPKVQQPELEKVTESLGAAKDCEKLRHLRPAEPGDHRRQPGDGELRQAGRGRRRRHPSRGRHEMSVTPQRPDTPEAGDDHDHDNDDADDQRGRPAPTGRLAGPPASTGRSGLPWILPAMIVSVGLLYYCIFYTGYISTLDWDGAAPLREQRRVGQLCADGRRIRSSGGPSPTPRCSSW